MHIIKKGAFSFRALVQKIRSYFEYKKPHHYWYWKFKNIKERSKILFACCQFWKIPSVIASFQDAMYKAEEEIWELTDQINKQSEEKDRLLDLVIDDRIDSGEFKSITEKGWYYKNALDLFNRKIISREEYLKNRGTKIFDESHEDYEDDLQKMRRLYEEWGERIDSCYLPEKEAEDRMWNDFDNSRVEAADFGPDNFDTYRSWIDKNFYDHHKFLRNKFPKMYRKGGSNE
tara:strand:+ start:641 stop:1333 length:693 start_codon:yes stop_codon:yes gene_type:complete